MNTGLVRTFFFLGLAILVACCAVLLKRTVPFEIQTLLAEDHPRRIQYEADLKSFNDEGVVWLVVHRPQPFLAAEIHDLSEAIGRHLDMDDSFESISGPHNAKYFEFDKEDKGFKLVPFLENGEWTERAREVLKTEMWRDSMIRDDDRSFLVGFRFRPDLERKREKPAVDRLEKFLASLRDRSPGIETAILGAKVASAAFLGEMGFQQRVITPLLLLALGIFLWFCFRSWQIVLWNFVVMFVCYAATLCLIITLEGGLGPYSSFALMFAFIVATTDLIHFFGRLQQLDGTVDERLEKTCRIAFVPCLLTSLTTAAGFLALIVNQNLPIRYFGLYCAFSCLLEWLIIFYVLPHLLRAFSFDPGPHRWQTPKLAKAIAPFVHRHATTAVVVSILLIVSTVITSFNLKIDDNFYTKFVSRHSLSRAIELFSKEFNFVGSIDVVIEPAEGATPSRDDRRALEGELSSHPVVARVASIRQVEDALDEELARAEIARDFRDETRNSIVGMMLDYGNLRDFVNQEKSETRTIVFLKSLATEDLDRVLGLIDTLATKHQSKFKIRPAGFSVIRSFINGRVITDFFESFFLSMGLIFVCYLFLYRSFKWSFLALIPNALPLLAISGLMGAFGVPVDTNLVILICVVFGVAGDNTIHLTYVLRQERATGLSYGDSLEKAWKLIGIAMVGTCGAFLFCLPVFLLGSLQLFNHIAIFLSVAFIVAFFADAIVFPAFQIKWGWGTEPR